MTKAELIEKLKGLADDAQVHLDDDSYPQLVDVMSGDEIEGADPEDAPPDGAILLQFE